MTMKPFLCIFFVLLSLCACTDNADVETLPGGQLTLKVQTSDFVSSTETRTPAEDGYKTVFKGDEQIGITAVKNGAVYNGMDNIPFAYNAAASTWTPVNAAIPYLYYYPGVTYIAYYPYSSGMGGKVTEQEIINAFTPQSDQSSYDAYTASDLMTATGAVTGSGGAYDITFDLKHRMSMIEASVYTKYFTTSVTGGYDYSSIIDYPVKNVNEGKIAIDGVEYPSCGMGDGTFRVLFKPGQTARSVRFSFQLAAGQPRHEYADRTQRQIEGGKYYLYSIVTSKSTPAVRQVSPGDFYYNTGDILPYDAVGDGDEIPLKTECIGIVFHAGAGTNDELSYYSGSGLATANAIHGYVMALQDAGSGSWGVRGDTAPIPQIERGEGAEERPSYRGYKNTKAILALNNASYQVFSYANQYNTTVAAPANSSGWYLPTIQQMQDFSALYRESGSILSASMQKAGAASFSGSYWTASQAYSLCSYEIVITSGSVNSTSGKQNGKNSRAALTF